jgi:glyoxylase-like metal-dependent hydrolase (beta-lactamase superfamily II)
MQIKEFFDPDTYTLTYVVHKNGAREAIVIDPVLDLDEASGKITDTSVKKVIAYLEEQKLEPVMCLETHAHADHLSGSQILKKHYPKLSVAISERITEVQKIFTKAFNLEGATDGSQFDYLFRDNEEKTVADLKVKEIPTPGHTPACSSYLIEDAVFTGDAIFMPDYGVGRCDFPSGSAKTLYSSVTKNLFTLPDSTRVFVGHDYQPNGRKLEFVSTIGAQKEKNIQLNASVSEAEFIAKREARDKTLKAPRLLLPSIQVNIFAGHLPEPENNGTRYLKLPLKVLV